MKNLGDPLGGSPNIYMAAAASHIVFANAAGSIGWSNLILVWAVLVFCGILVALPWNKLLHRTGHAW